ncbi:DEAD/DEAH box helicase [Methylovulum psychrotolerans]|uniref:DEAD/DEAH box helicase n=1 Tax=Methylovulum psychrotolerans TaxID=1704499 RepID=UPI001BFF109B|nr:ATP-binding domain-containing protein [Methylovulum psychrotolerans]MBT9100547.1 DEAD/DEAH box helicase [Methylovulum psychrotolerans]
MSIAIYPKEHAFRNDQAASFLLNHFRDNEDALNLSNASIFCNFPLFREENDVLSVKFAIISPSHGVILISTPDNNKAKYDYIRKELDSTFSQVFSRLIKYPKLRKNKITLDFNLDSFLFLAEESNGIHGDDVVISLPEIKLRLNKIKLNTIISEIVFNELISALDGSKALIRAPERDLDNFDKNSKVVQIAALEEEIRKFDIDQRIAYMTEIYGTQRIRGLAGSGKTVVLAMKAAITLIRNPNAKIAFTFYTKSLYQHIKQLITRFYRLYDDKDPDPDRLMIFHAWGGETVQGLYAYASKFFAETPMTYSYARSYNPSQPFDFVCKKLLSNPSISPIFDYIFVDEAQDFPPSFLRLALKLAEEEKLVIAYDSLQTIFDVDIPTAGVLFGTDERGEPSVTFDEDIILHRCYRNPKEILITAHALGFGIYAPKVIQMLESKEHWEDLGYKVISDELISGESVEIERPCENSPSTISAKNKPEDIVNFKLAENFNDEISYVIDSIIEDIKKQGVSPEDILVISADNIHTKDYFKFITKGLFKHNININNLQDDTFGIRDFQSKSKVTLSTIYKAKGNEAYIVYLVGVEAIFSTKDARKRNLIFTAMTRSKAWLRISGTGNTGKLFEKEFKRAVSNLPNLIFKYPDPEELTVMKRDLSRISESEINEAIARLEEDMSPEEQILFYTQRIKEARRKTSRKITKSNRY